MHVLYHLIGGTALLGAESDNDQDEDIGSDSQHVGQQYIELPRAISGNLHKGQKSYTTTWLESCYNDLICNQLPGGWVPDVVLEGMFMINTSPLTTHNTMKDYSQFLLPLVDSLIPVSHLNVDVGMTQHHCPLTISM